MMRAHCHAPNTCWGKQVKSHNDFFFLCGNIIEIYQFYDTISLDIGQAAHDQNIPEMRAAGDGDRILHVCGDLATRSKQAIELLLRAAAKTADLLSIFYIAPKTPFADALSDTKL